MTDKPNGDPPLDPDEVACPRCGSGPAEVCKTPTGRRAKTVHRERRDLAADFTNAQADVNPATPQKRQSPATPEGRSKGGKEAQRRKAEVRAEIAELVGESRAAAIIAQAEKLAADASRFDTDRMTLKRLVLDTALDTWGTFREAVEGYRHAELDEDRRPKRIPVETVELVADPRSEDGTGLIERRKIVQVLDVVGAFGPDDVKALATAAGIALDKVRLEEGSATSRNEYLHGGTNGQGLGDLNDADLRKLADTTSQALGELGGDE